MLSQPTNRIRRLLATRPARLTGRVLGVLVLLTLSAWLAFRPDASEQARLADSAFVGGRYLEAYQRYSRLATAEAGPRAQARLGMVQVVRGELVAANRTLALALQRGAAGRDYELVRLYQGQAALRSGQLEEALGLWRTIGPGSPLLPYRQVLAAEGLFQAGRYGEAETTYRDALAGTLLPGWQRLAQSRVAALRATSDPAAAQVLLAQIGPAPADTPDTEMIAPLLPTAGPAPEQLAAALAEPAARRALLLGQLYAAAGLYPLAEAQFAQVPASDPASVQAQANSALVRLRAGDPAGATAQLVGLATANPRDITIRATLVLAYLEQGDLPRAQSQLQTARALAPNAPETFLAWGQWYAAQSDYLAAADAYQQALAAAPIAQRDTYLLALARFHLNTTVDVCAAGRPAAEETARTDRSPQVLTVLANARLACRDYTGAAEAASAALDADPANAEAAFYQGQALVLLGQREQGRSALVAAADMAPASQWRAKAESELALYGL